MDTWQLSSAVQAHFNHKIVEEYKVTVSLWEGGSMQLGSHSKQVSGSPVHLQTCLT